MITKEVFVSRVRDFLHEIARLNKKAARIGVAPIAIEDLGKVTKMRTSVVVDQDGNEDARTYPVDCQQYRITVSEPADCPWVPLVKITPDGEGNAFAEALAAGTLEDAAAWKNADALNCDHCHVRRARNISYVVRHKTDGRIMQLGRNCFGDYVGEDTLRALEFVDLVIASIGGDDEGYYDMGGGGIGYKSTVRVRDCVAYAEMLCRKEGWRNNVRNQYDGSLDQEGTHRIAGRFVTTCPQQVALALKDEDYAAADAAISRMQEIETTDEFGATLKNLADYQWVPFPKAALVAYTGQFLRNIDQRAQEAALNAKRVYRGTVGQREVFERLTCVRCPSFENDFGRVYVNTFEDADHNVLIWKTGSTSCAVGNVVTLKGTVKEHSQYRDTKQTVLTRCKAVD